MKYWRWEARAEARILTDVIDSVMDQMRQLLATEPEGASISFCIRLSIEEFLVQNPAITQTCDQDALHTVVVRSNRQELTIGIDSKFADFTFPNG